MRLESRTYTHLDGNTIKLVPSEHSGYYLVGLYGPGVRRREAVHGTHGFQQVLKHLATQLRVFRNTAEHH